jgi:hypothetical protein
MTRLRSIYAPPAVGHGGRLALDRSRRWAGKEVGPEYWSLRRRVRATECVGVRGERVVCSRWAPGGAGVGVDRWNCSRLRRSVTRNP